MATLFLTNGNDSRLLNVPGTYVVDGLAGTDTIDFGTSTSTDYEITLGSDGGVQVDTVSGASQQFHGTFYNFEIFKFSSGRETIDLATYFSASQPPTVAITDFTSGVAIAAVNYTLTFSKPVTGLVAGDFDVSGGSIVSLAGSGTGYTVMVQPTGGAEGSIGFTLKAGAVQDSGGLTNAATSAAAQAFDTLAPSLAAGSPSVGASGVATAGPIVIDFSEAVHAGTGTVVLRDAAGAQLAFWSSSDVGALLAGNRLTLTPSRALPSGATLSVDLGAGVVLDSAGNSFAATSFTFSTSGVVAQTGGAGNDTFAVNGGQYTIDGAGGIDQAVLAAARSSFGLTKTTSGFTLASLDGKTSASLVSIERLGFSDQRLALDLESNAGIVAKTLGAVLGRGSVQDPALAGIGLQLMDAGTSYEGLMQLALDFKLGAGASHTAVVGLLFGNVVGRAPSDAESAFYVALLDNRTYTPAILGTIAADNELNLANIDFVGLAQEGLVYT